MARAYDLPLDPGMTEEFDFRPHEPVVDVGPFRVESATVVHPVDAFALRVTADGRSVAYSGDTGPCEPLERARRGAPTCSSARRPSATARTTRPTCT